MRNHPFFKDCLPICFLLFVKIMPSISVVAFLSPFGFHFCTLASSFVYWLIANKPSLHFFFEHRWLHCLLHLHPGPLKYLTTGLLFCRNEISPTTKQRRSIAFFPHITRTLFLWSQRTKVAFTKQSDCSGTLLSVNRTFLRSTPISDIVTLLQGLDPKLSNHFSSFLLAICKLSDNPVNKHNRWAHFFSLPLQLKL